MVKKTDVIICDECDERVSKAKCSLCEMDICENCDKALRFWIGDANDNNFLYNISLCYNCQNKVTDKGKDFWSKEFKSELGQSFRTYIKKNMIVLELESKKKMKTRDE